MAEILVNESGAAVAAHVGDDVVVRLPENPTTGHVWSPALEPDHLSLQSDDYVPGMITSTRPGAGGERVFRFRADRPGEGALRLELRRPWESRAVDQVEVSVTVE